MELAQSLNNNDFDFLNLFSYLLYFFKEYTSQDHFFLK